MIVAGNIDWEQRLAGFISVVLHPLLIPTITLYILLRQNGLHHSDGSERQWIFLGLVSMTTFVLPALMIWLMVKTGFVGSLSMKRREERMGPVLVTALFFYLTYYIARKMNIAPEFYVYMLGATLLAIVSLLITIYWKISLHMVAAGGSTAAFAEYALLSGSPMQGALIACLILSGTVGFARLKLSAHKPAEVYTGYLLGFGLIWTVYLLIR